MTFTMDQDMVDEINSLRARVAAQEATIAMLGKTLKETRDYAALVGSETDDVHRSVIEQADIALSDPAVSCAIALDEARREVCEAAALSEFRSAEFVRRGNPSSLTLNMYQAEQGLIDALSRLRDLEGEDGE